MSLLLKARDFAKATLPHPKWLVEELLPGDGWSLLVAPTRTGKSLLAMQLSIALATSGAFLGRHVPKTRVAYIQLDAPPGDWQTQIERLPDEQQEFMTVTRLQLPLYVLDKTPKTDLMRVRLRDDLKEAGIQFVVWDALEKLTRADLNTKDGCQQTLDRLATIFPGTALIIHHPRKGREGEAQHDTAAGNHYLLADASGQWFLSKTGPATGTLKVSTRLTPDLTLKLEREPKTGLWLPAKPSAPVSKPKLDDDALAKAWGS